MRVPATPGGDAGSCAGIVEVVSRVIDVGELDDTLESGVEAGYGELVIGLGGAEAHG